jgi:hypothetical protein
MFLQAPLPFPVAPVRAKYAAWQVCQVTSLTWALEAVLGLGFTGQAQNLVAEFREMPENPVPLR